MKIIEKVLKKKLVGMGYDEEKISNQLKQIDFDLIDKQIAFENEAEDYIKIIEYSEPTVEVPRMLINYDKNYIQTVVIDGDINLSTAITSINTSMPIVDYKISSTVCIVATTLSLGVEILIYSPSMFTIQQYPSETYEDILKKERNNIAKEYYEAFVANGRVNENKVKGILALLLSEYIFDEIALTNANPKIKMYDNPDAYAEGITEYRLKYINRRTNRIELAYRPTYIKRLGVNVSAGLVSNDPYIKLDNLPQPSDFPLDIVSCYWVNGTKNRKEEVAIYIATKPYGDFRTYREYQENNTERYEDIANALKMQFQRECNTEIDKEYLKSVLKKLNPELLIPSMSVIKSCMENPNDLIEPIRYKFKAISDPADFEERLYISIEDNLGKRYKYKLTENILNDLTRIGNKLEYTGEDGNIVRKQSIADFNVNSNTAIIRRETLIDYSKIPGLLGYIYEDMEYIGTDMLPVPSIEVDFYFAANGQGQVVMFNGTNLSTDYASYVNANKFNAISGSGSEEQASGTTYATVKYVNSRGGILKENRINNLFPGSTYVPEILPVINDVNGYEWVCATTQFPTTVINILPEYNVIEVKYKEKFSKVTVTFLNRDGKKICDDLVETVQAGSFYNIENKREYTDDKANDWTLITARPQKLLIKDDPTKNNLILVYDLEKETVTVRYLNKDGKEIAPVKTKDVQVGKIYEVNVERIYIDANKLGWIYNGKTPISHLVEDDKPNVIDVSFEEYKLPVTTKYQSEDGITVLNDKKEYLQVGQKYVPEYDEEIVDFNCKIWKLKEIDKKEFTVSKNENENVIKVLYEPKLAKVTIQLINEMGAKIASPIQKLCQIGDEFSSVSLNEVTDNYGKMWEKKEDPKTLVVSQNEAENNVSIKYKPLIANIVVKFFDDERNELVEEKKYEQQAGTVFKPEIIERLESPDGRKWYLNKDKVKEITVRKNIEENIVSIFYEKELTDVYLEFVDAYNNTLRDSTIVKAQIGSIFSEKMFNKIEDREGCKWMIESTEPKKMIVKDSGNRFKLYYGEVKAIVIVKHINIKTNKTILDDVITKVKLGGVFVPNIREKVLDSNKFLWKFIGDKNMSIVVKENEQENIVILQYEEAVSKVSVKYYDLLNNKLRDDVVYELQIGQNVDYKKMETFLDANGMGWKLDSSKTKNPKVMENADENEVINFYNPLLAKVKVVYVNEGANEIKQCFEKELQVGKTFAPEYEDLVRDDENLLWKFKEISAKEIKVSESGNVIEVKYLPVLSSIVQKMFSKTGEVIGEEIKDERQVGSEFTFEIEPIFIDKENKKWNFIKADKSSVVVKENEEQNIINRFYEPRMASGIIKIYDDNNNEIMEPKKFTAQIGSKYTALLSATYIEPKTKLGWKHDKVASDTIVVNDDNSKNVVAIRYDKWMVQVKDRVSDMDGNNLLPDKEKLLQVGKTYEPKAEESIVDSEGKEWIFAGRQENKLFGGHASGFITVSEKPEQNIAYIKYKPLLAPGIIKYQDNLGGIIKEQDEFNAQVGSKYTPNIKEVIMDIKKNKWTYNPNSKSTITISKDKNKNVIILSYEEEKAPVIYKYQDEFKNRLKTPRKILAQIGSTYIPDPESVITDEQGRAWELKDKNVQKLEVKDSEQENVIEVTYSPLCVEVILNIRNRKGDLIFKNTEKAQLGSKFKPSLDDTICDDKSMMFRFVKCEPQEILVKEVPIGSEEELNVFEVTYEPVYSNVSIIYQDIDGNKLKDDEIIQLQVGTKYTPKLIQFVKDRRGIQWENITKEVDTIRVMENSKDNIVKMTFELAKAEVLVKYKNLEGNIIKESKRYEENIGTEFVPEVENVIADSKNRKWIFSAAEPVKITVGSINNVITLTYLEKKVPVTIRYESINGKKLREDVIVNVQEGTQFIPKKNYTIIYDENEIWKYLEFRPSSLLVTDKEAENVIVQVYANNNEERDENSRKLINPFANTLTEEEKKEEEVIEEKENLIEEKKEEAEEKNANEIKFTEPNLIELSKSVLLEEDEKKVIIELNQINKDIIQELNNFKNNFDFSNQDEAIRIIDELMNKEKETIEKGLSNMFADDKTGKKFLKILEAIVSLDKDYQRMQERKVILLTDYFINSQISVNEQVNYICERGKINLELIQMQDKINVAKKDREAMQEIYVNLIYEKAMLDSYYKTRTKAKDEYFLDESQKNSLGSDIIIAVTNLLPKQAFSLLQKDNKLTIQQENELEAIVALLNAQQMQTIEKMINSVPNGGLRKSMSKRLKNMVS